MILVVEVFIQKQTNRKTDRFKRFKNSCTRERFSISNGRTIRCFSNPISWGELYTALQQGVVDGAENNPPSFYLSKHYEVCKYYSINEHTSIPDVLIVSTHFWNRLSDKEKEWLQKSIDQSIPFQRKLWIKSEKKSLEAVIKAGVKVIYPNKKIFQEATKAMYLNLKR